MRRQSLTGRLVAIVLTVVIGGVASAAAAGDTSAPAAPAKLSETGLYLDIATYRVDPRNFPFEPQYPLWTDGADKSRWIRLPEHSAIDASDTSRWVLPVGAKLWKEFAFGGHRVETRMIWRATADHWVYATYVWNDAQTDATLAPPDGVRNHFRTGERSWHSIPAAFDCMNCHDASTKPILGFSALQLSDDRDPLAPHQKPLREGMLTISSLERMGLLSPRRPDLVVNPPRIPARTPHERAALGYLSSNCGSCHNARGPLEVLGMALEYEEGTSDAIPSGRATTVGVPSHWVIPDVASGLSRRIAPGSPEASAILYRMSSTHASTRMPPIGSSIVDHDAVALIRLWIEEDLRATR